MFRITRFSNPQIFKFSNSRLLLDGRLVDEHDGDVVFDGIDTLARVALEGRAVFDQFDGRFAVGTGENFQQLRVDRHLSANSMTAHCFCGTIQAMRLVVLCVVLAGSVAVAEAGQRTRQPRSNAAPETSSSAGGVAEAYDQYLRGRLLEREE